MSLIYKLLYNISNYHQNLRYKIYRNNYSISDDFRFNGKDIFFYGKGYLKIENNSYIGSLSTIQLHENCSVTIGQGCSISHNVRIYTTTKDPDFDFSDKNNIPIKTGDVLIGKNVWIGANVFINPGIKIGDNSVIGANSVVTKNVEPFGIYGGVPAKLLRMKDIK